MTQMNMLDGSQGPNPKRLLLAVVATSAVLMAYSYFFAPVPTEVTTEAPQKTEKIASPETEKPAPHSLGMHPDATPGDIAVVEKTFSVPEVASGELKRVSYKATLSSLGGVIDSYALSDFTKDQEIFDRAHKDSYLLKLSSLSPHISLAGNEHYKLVSAEDREVLFSFVTKEGLKIDRHYELLEGARIRETVTFSNITDTPLKAELNLEAIKTGVATESSFFNPSVSGESLVVKHGGKHERLALKDVTDAPKSFTNAEYAAFDDQFFISAILIKKQEAISDVVASASKIGEDKVKATITLNLKPIVLVPKEEFSLTNELFIGPKQIDVLKALNPPLDENIDFGWFGVLSRPMLWLLTKIYDFVHNYGLAIILITVIIKLLTYPLTHKSFTSQQEMKKLQPKLKELQGKYGYDRTLLGQKQMELYKEHGVNPVAGCLPMLIQLPIWFAFFQMLRNSVELFDQPFYLWITDLTMPDHYFVLPISMGASMLVQQAFTPMPADQPQMKYVMWAMPIFLTFIMLNMPAGLSLYILTNNLLTIFQQIIIKRHAAKINP